MFRDNARSCKCIFEWHKRFKEWHKEVKDDSKCRRPSTSRTKINIEQVRQVVCGCHQLTVQNDSKSVGHDKGQCLEDSHRRFGHVKSLNKNCARLINDDQKEHCMQIYQDILEHLQTESGLLHRVITGDETWIFGLVLWHINPYGLYNAKSCLCMHNL